MALVALVAYDPPGEPRTELLRDCLDSLHETINPESHRLVIVSNGVTKESRDWIRGHVIQTHCAFLENETNLGTARAINQAWKLRQPGEHCVKIDSDVVLHECDWLDKLEECVDRDPTIGIIGLKRKDLAESPNNPPGQWSHSTLHMLPHKNGQSWLVVEKVNHVMGTCVLHSSALLDKVGYLYQYGGLYGCDDSDMSIRSECAGFYNCFLCNCQISHPDPGGDNFTRWKQDYASEQIRKYLVAREQYRSGALPLYRGPSDE